MLVVIPTAGLGSRLDLSTKYLNKSMIQLGDLPVISKIIDSYPPKTKFIILIGYKGEHISEYLKLVYKKRNIKIINVNLYIGEGSGLTYTLKKSLKLIKEPFFFHANDTIFLDTGFYKNIKTDTLFISKGKSDTMKFATVEINKDYKKVHGKLNYLRKDFFNYTGVAFISDYRKFKYYLKKDKVNNGELSYFKNIDPNKINYKFVSQWFDIGSKESKEKAEKYFATKSILPKLDQAIYFKNNKVYKFFTNPEVLKKRFKRASILYPNVPKILTKSKYFYVYKYVKGVIFSKVEKKTEKFEKLLGWLLKKFWIKKKLNQQKKNFFVQRCNSFYYEKSLSRINYLYEKNNINDRKEKINNLNTNKISNLFEKIDWTDINNGIPVNFHGDLHFENILSYKNKITLLDWREDYSGILNFGDIYYDLAKINHGLIIDHNMVKNFEFKVKLTEKNISLYFKQSKENKACQKFFYKFLRKNNFSKKKVEIITSLIFLNIAALHHYPYSIFLYYLGKHNLAKALKS